MDVTSGASSITALQVNRYRYDVPEMGGEAARLEKVAHDFEALFIKQMLDTMRETLNKEDRIVDSGMAGDIFEDMLYDEYAVMMSKTGGFGLADMIVEQYRT